MSRSIRKSLTLFVVVVLTLMTNIAPIRAASCPGGGIYDDTSPYIFYSGPWIRESGFAGFYNGTVSYTDINGAYARFEFIGRGIYLCSDTGPWKGTYRIWLDYSSPIAYYNFYSPTRQTGVCVSFLGLQNTYHWFMLDNNGGGKFIDIDYIYVVP